MNPSVSPKGIFNSRCSAFFNSHHQVLGPVCQACADQGPQLTLRCLVVTRSKSESLVIVDPQLPRWPSTHFLGPGSCGSLFQGLNQNKRGCSSTPTDCPHRPHPHVLHQAGAYCRHHQAHLLLPHFPAALRAVSCPAAWKRPERTECCIGSSRSCESAGVTLVKQE